MKTHFVMHESFESPAAIELWTQQRGFDTSFTHLHLGETFPSPSDFDLLIVMGGPQSPDTTKQECPHFDGPKEVAFIRKAIERGKYVLGVCLGAQLIGEALGARFDHSPQREIGVFPIQLTDAGQTDPCFRDFPHSFEVGHWHGDMPGLTADCKVLATSAGCPRQVISYSPRVYGFQCHFEFTPSAIHGMIANSAAELESYRDLPFVESAAALLAHNYSAMNQLLFNFLDQFVSVVSSTQTGTAPNLAPCVNTSNFHSKVHKTK